METKEKINWNVVGKVEKWSQAQADEHGPDVARLVEPEEVQEFEGNALLNLGINLMLQLLIGGGSGPYNNASAKIGVGNSSNAVDANQTGLQGASQLYKAMNATYPTVANQTVTFQSEFGTGDANFNWLEWSIHNSAGTPVNLNRKVVDLGTKQGGVWTLTVSITIS